MCGEESTQTILLSTNRFGAPDLDFRPPEMMRSTMCWWVQECPHCGYVAEDLEEKADVTDAWLRSDEYTGCNGICFCSELAERFYKDYLIKLRSFREKHAFYAALHAAWSCDDAGDTRQAIYCRTLALDVICRMEKAEKANENLLLIKADLLRRTGAFKALITEFEKKTFSEDIMNRVIAFQIDRAKKKDTRRYTVEDATRGA